MTQEEDKPVLKEALEALEWLDEYAAVLTLTSRRVVSAKLAAVRLALEDEDR